MNKYNDSNKSSEIVKADPFGALSKSFRTLSEEDLESMRKRYNALVEGIPRKDRITGIPTGFIDIDIQTEGLPYGVSAVGARPEDGLTDFGLNIVLNASAKENRVLYINPQIDSKLILKRALMIDSKILAEVVKESGISPEEMKRIVKSLDKLTNQEKIHFYCGYEMTPEQFRTTCKKYAENKGVNLVVLDRLQSILPLQPQFGNSYYSAGKEVSDIFHEVVSEDGLALLVLCEAKKKGKELISTNHLRDCGALEYTARPLIMFERVQKEHNQKFDSRKPNIRGTVTNNLEGELNFDFNLGYLSNGRFTDWAE